MKTIPLDCIDQVCYCDSSDCFDLDRLRNIFRSHYLVKATKNTSIDKAESDSIKSIK